MSKSSQIEYHDTLDFEIDPDDVLIFDEADQYMFENSQQFMQLIDKQKVICLTATSGGLESGDLYTEQTVLEIY